MDLELRGKSVSITGGSKGIGLACAHGFAAEGARVHIASRTETALKACGDMSETIVIIDNGNSARARG